MEQYRPRVFLSSLLAFGLILPVLAQRGPGGDAVRDLPAPIRLMLDRAGKQRYTGQRVVEFRAEGNRIRNTEVVTVDGRFSRTEFLTGSDAAGQIIIDGPRGRQHFYPDRNEIIVGPSPKDEGVARLRMLLKKRREGALRMTFSAGGNIAGRATLLMAVADRAGNSIQRLWVDEATGLPLKRELYDRVGTKTGSFEFTRINFAPRIDPKDFEINRRGAKIVPIRDILLGKAKELGFTVYSLPDTTGAALQNIRIVDLAGGKGLVQSFSRDGRVLTLFQLKSAVNMERLQRASGGRGKAHRWNVGGYTLVLVGDLPPAELQALAKQVRSL